MVKTNSRLMLVIIVAVVVRVGLALYLGNDLTDHRGGTADQLSYDTLAQRVAAGYGFSFSEAWWPYAKPDTQTSFWSFLYTSYLAAVYTFVGHNPLVARLTQAIVLGVLFPLLTFRLTSRLFEQHTAVVAAAIAAGYGYFIVYSAALMTEGPYIVAILWLLDATFRLKSYVREIETGEVLAVNRRLVWLALELGLAIGVATLLRQVIVVVLGTVYLLWWVWQLVRVQNRLSLVAAGAISVTVVAAMLAPWMVRNYRLFGEIALPNTNAGFAFFWANHEIYGTRFEAVLSPEHGVSYQELIPEELRDLNEMQLDRALMQLGFREVSSDPQRYVLLSLSRIPIYFQFWPSADSSLLSNVSRMLSFGLFLPFMLFGLFLVIKREFLNQSNSRLHLSEHVLLLALIVGYTGVHLASWANVRYRLPVDAILIIYAAHAIVQLYRHIQLMPVKRVESRIQSDQLNAI